MDIYINNKDIDKINSRKLPEVRSTTESSIRLYVISNSYQPSLMIMIRVLKVATTGTRVKLHDIYLK
jgi:hypothetical protein